MLRGILFGFLFGLWVPSYNAGEALHDVRIPEADGLLHVYALPIGVGDCNVIQCPDGTLAIMDMGTADPSRTRFWAGPELRAFLEGNFGLIQNIVVTHNDWDHYLHFPDTLNDPAELTGLLNIYISCTMSDADAIMNDWVTAISAGDRIRTFNNGGQCGPRGGPCGSIDICPNNPEITLDVLAANLGQHCTDGQWKNPDSIISKITYNDFTILLPADIQDETTDLDEDGPQKWMVDFYGAALQSTVYEVAYHGNIAYSNKPIWIEAISPTFIFSTADPWYFGEFPTCKVFDDIINLQTLCKPGITDPVDPEYCGMHTLDNPDMAEILQTTYTCGMNATELEYRTGNEYALYTGTPDETTVYLIDVSTDGTRHGIRFEDATI